MSWMTRICMTLMIFAAASTNTEAAGTVRVASGLSRPLYVTAPLQDYDRIFIVEQWTAMIKILHVNSGTIDIFLHIDSIVVGTGNERGLLGLCFHPDYADNGYFYVHYNDNAGNSVIARYSVTADPDVADAGSRFNIIEMAQPAGQTNHKGGMIAFGTDGYLYIGMGDGGSANDPGNRAQNDQVLLGKMLRIDVDGGTPYAIPPDNPFVGSAPLDEIWAKGLRNPWRWSFDRLTGDLYIADVGQGAWEEVNFRPDSSAGGENYGWRCMEGDHCTGLGGCTCFDPSLTDPIHEYSHGAGCSVTGGFVYRGCAIPEFEGLYFFADYCSDVIWSGRYDPVNDTLIELTNRTADLAPGGGLSIGDISSFGEDAYGEMYICDLAGGEVFKIVPDVMADCNNNDISDRCDIASGMSADTNGNDIPDECDCFAVTPNNLTISSDSTTILLRWTATGNGLESYSVYRNSDSEEPFPGGAWLEVATGLPSIAGANAMLYMEGISPESAAKFFYLVAADCP